MVLKGDALFLERTVNLPVAIVAVVLGLNGGDSFHDFLEHILILLPVLGHIVFLYPHYRP